MELVLRHLGKRFPKPFCGGINYQPNCCTSVIPYHAAVPLHLERNYSVIPLITTVSYHWKVNSMTE